MKLVIVRLVVIKGEKLKKQKFKLKRNVKESKEILKPIETSIQEVLSKYLDCNLHEVGSNIEVDMKTLFKKYPKLEYKGLYSQLGMMEDLKVLFSEKEK